MPDIGIYKEDPARYVSECYQEFKDYYSKNMEAADDEAKSLFCGYSERLEEVKSDEWVEASSIFSPMILPHILSRVAQFMGTLFSADPIVKWLPLPGTPPDNAKKIQELVLNSFMGDYMQNTVRLTELLTAAELRKEAWVKLTVKADEYQELDLEDDIVDLGMSPEELAQMGISLPSPTEPYRRGTKRVLKTIREEPAPSWDLLPEKAFIRYPYAWRKEDWLYCGDHKWVTEAYLRSKELSGDYKNIDEAIKEASTDSSGDGGYPDDTVFNLEAAGKSLSAVDSFSYDKMAERIGKQGGASRYQNSHHLIELWVIVPKKTTRPIELPLPHPPQGEKTVWTGENEVRIITTVNGIKVADRPKREPFLQITWPYVQFKSITIPNQMEGLSTAEIEAPLQHLENDLCNLIVDMGHYATFAPMQIDSRCRVLNDAVWAPTRIWKVEGLYDYGGVKPIIPSSSLGGLSVLQQERMNNKLSAENLVGATDLIQGSRNTKTDRTLGETQIRHQGTVSRLNLTLINYAAGIMEICDGFEKMYQELVPLERPLSYFTGRWDEAGNPREEQVTFSNIKGRFKKTMQHVAEYVDSTNERLLWDLLFTRLAQDPLFLTPERHYKLVRRFMEANRVPNIDDLIGPQPEMGAEELKQLLITVFGNVGKPQLAGGIPAGGGFQSANQ